MSDPDAHPTEHHTPIATTRRPDFPELEGGVPLPEELTGRASATSEDVTELFDEKSATHLADGFRGGGGDDQDVEPVTEGEESTEEPEGP